MSHLLSQHSGAKAVGSSWPFWTTYDCSLGYIKRLCLEKHKKLGMSLQFYSLYFYTMTSANLDIKTQCCAGQDFLLGGNYSGN